MAWLAAILLTVCLLPAIAQAAVCRVKTVVDGGIATNDGHNWSQATTLRDALTNGHGKSCSEIWVAKGVYTPDASDRNVSFNILPGVAVYGGFLGVATETTRAARDPAANLTVLSGDLNGDDGPNFANNADNSDHIVTMSGINTAITSATVLDGFTITGGNANGAAPRQRRWGPALQWPRQRQ